jgi:hypothetical protein
MEIPAYSSSVEDLADSLGLERGPLATFARDQPLRFAIDASVWPDGCSVGDCAPVL